MQAGDIPAGMEQKETKVTERRQTDVEQAGIGSAGAGRREAEQAGAGRTEAERTEAGRAGTEKIRIKNAGAGETGPARPEAEQAISQKSGRARKARRARKTLSIYVHIPFCVRKCNYCDFLSYPAGKEAMEDYQRVLLLEIEKEAGRYAEYEVQTVFIGGGTPSAVPPLFIQEIMEKIYVNFHVAADAEISMEANPGTVSRESLQVYRKSGINRLSIGLQSASDRELKELGRIHDYAGFLDTYRQAAEAGFSNINVDIMSALPGQTLADYEMTLNKVLSLKPMPAHISAYSLIVEEGTPFYELSGQGRLQLPDEEEERAMYVRTKELLREKGYHRYEISNYAREGFACRHNKAYWTRKNYAGFGLGAASLIENVRVQNEKNMEAYRDRIYRSMDYRERQALGRQEQMEEFMFLGLRLTEGVSAGTFRATFGIPIEEVYGEVLGRHSREGLLVWGDRIYLTDKGLDVSNYVMSDFLF